MNRRAFLASIAAALVVDPERALWLPGRKLISIPAPRVVRPQFVVADGFLRFLAGTSPDLFHPRVRMPIAFALKSLFPPALVLRG